MKDDVSERARELLGDVDGAIHVSVSRALRAIERALTPTPPSDLVAASRATVDDDIRRMREAITPPKGDLCERLRAKKTQHRVQHLFGGAISIPDESETREVPVNPDDPKAADRIEALEAENARLREAVIEAAVIVEGYADSYATMARMEPTPGRVLCSSVETDLRSNIAAAIRSLLPTLPEQPVDGDAE